MARPRNNSQQDDELGLDDGRPLYVRVQATLRERVRAGSWQPGEMIPSESEIGRELGVSQGTVRKALDNLTAEGVVVRRQGRGTFVVEHTPDDVLFRFFQLYEDDGRRISPGSVSTRARTVEADPAQRERLALAKGAHVVVIERLRVRDGVPFIVETIVLPRARFQRLDERSEIPNTLYDLFQKQYGVLVARADERLTAVNADARTAGLLGGRKGDALLKIDRVAFGLDDQPIEWRVSLVKLDEAHYLARLR